MECPICRKEIKEGEETVAHYRIDMHKNCESNYVDYENRTCRDYVKCKCGLTTIIFNGFVQGVLVGVGRCPCGKVYFTFNFPKEPRPQKPKAPQRLTEEQIARNNLQKGN